MIPNRNGEACLYGREFGFERNVFELRSKPAAQCPWSRQKYASKPFCTNTGLRLDGGAQMRFEIKPANELFLFLCSFLSFGVSARGRF